MSRNLGKTIASIAILSAVSLSCAGAAIGVRAANLRNIPEEAAMGHEDATVRSIVKIEKTKTMGDVDQYTITYSDEATSVFLVTNGKDGVDGIDGLPGKDGHTPTIAVGANGNWIIDGNDIGIKAEGLRGQDGHDGRGITSIEKTATYGNVDEYTITYTDNTTSTFVVKNGENGEQGIQGLRGEDGHTPEITIGENGHWFVDNVDSGVNASGPAGANGKTAYEIAVEKGYEGTLDEWLLSLVGATGAVGPAGQNGKSAYELAVEKGYEGTEDEWLTTLVGAAGQDGRNGTDGMSAYQIYCANHLDPDLPEEDWLDSLKGSNGLNGLSAYEIYISLNPGSTLSEAEWLSSLVGQNGQDGRGISSITGPVTDGKYETYTITYTDGSTPTQFVVTNGEDGRDGSSLLTGSGDPQTIDGKAGDSYINTTTWDYFKKEGNAWTKIGNIKGENGQDGNDGSDGVNGLNGKSIHAGNGLPSSELGAEGDSYVDVDAGEYYVKGTDTWTKIGSIKGNSGADGSDGNGIVEISLSSTTSETDTYTIAYSNGTNYSYTIAKPRSIVSIVKTSTEDNVDTYTITYSYGDDSTFTVTNGINGQDGQDGHDGADGRTILHGATAPDNAIGAQGDVYINMSTFDMYFKGMTEWGEPINFKGATGATGNGIASIEKTDTNGLVDTYTVTYTNNSTSTFTVTNGANGKDGTKVVAGTVAPSSTDGYQVGDSYIDTNSWDYYVLIDDGTTLTWNIRGNMRGAAGNDGNDGRDGTKLVTGTSDPSESTGYQQGDSFLNTDSWDYFVLTKNGSNELEWSKVGNIHASPNRYTVTFETNGGGTIPSIENVLEGKTIAKPTNPTKSGWYFEGWYTSEGNRWDFSKDVVNSDITLLARYGQLKVTNGVLTGCSMTGDVIIPHSYDGQLIEGISSSVFSNKDDITSVTLPNTIKAIPNGAFLNCYSLHTITLPDGLQTIGANAFVGTSINYINLPDTITTIGNSAFEGTPLISVVLPKSLNTLGTAVFRNSPLFCALFPSPLCQLTELFDSTFENCYNLRDVVFSERSIMASIGENAFKNCSQLESITLPESVSTIDAWAFYGCEALSTLALPNSISSIGNYAFGGCCSLIKVELPIGVKDLGDSCFQGCSSLEELTIQSTSYNSRVIKNIFGGSVPSSLKRIVVTGNEGIANGAFAGCANVKEVEFASGTNSFASGCLSGLDGLEELTLPYLGLNASETTYLGYLFGGSSASDNSSVVPSSLEKVTVMNSGTEINQYAFQNCSNLKSIVIRTEMASFAYGETTANVFEGCSSLEYLEIPFVGLKTSASDSEKKMSVLFNGDENVPSSLKEIVITKETHLVPDAFKDFTNLKKITLPDTLTSIDHNVFENAGIESIIIPDSVTLIGSYAFKGCVNLKSVTLPHNENFTTISLGAFEGCVKLRDIIIPDGVTELGNDSFRGCVSLTSLAIPDTVTSIGQYAFSGCKKLVYVFLPDNLITLGEYAFENCSMLERIDLPSGIGTIGNAAFKGCESLSLITGLDSFGESLTSKTIGSNAFEGCDKLTSLNITTSKEFVIGIEAFKGCDGLMNVTLTTQGSGALTVGSYAFASCSALGLLTLAGPSDSIVLKDSSFSNCSLLSVVQNGSNNVRIEAHAFDGCISLWYFSGDSNFYTRIKSIGDYAFQNCKSLREIDCEGVESIGDYAFTNCTSLKTVETDNFSVSAVAVGKGVFKGCSSLESVNIPGLSVIPDEFFRDCSSLQEFKLNYNVTEIGNYAFSNTKLSDVDFTQPLHLVSIGDYAFEYTAIKNVDLRQCTELTTLGEYAFAYCENLTNAMFNFFASQIRSIPEGAFLWCTNLVGVSIPNSVREIGDRAFERSGVSSMIMNNVTSIGESAFYGCTKLTSIDLPNTVRTIGEEAFAFCSELESVTLPTNSQFVTIAEKTFYSCSALTSIVIPASVSLIEAKAFGSTSVLKTVTFLRTTLDLEIQSGNFAGLTAIKTALSSTDYSTWINSDIVAIKSNLEAKSGRTITYNYSA